MAAQETIDHHHIGVIKDNPFMKGNMFRGASKSVSHVRPRFDSDSLNAARQPGKITKVISQWHIREEQNNGGFLTDEEAKRKLGPPPKKDIYSNSQNDAEWMNPHLKTGFTPEPTNESERIVAIETTVTVEHPQSPESMTDDDDDDTLKPNHGQLTKAKSYSALVVQPSEDERRRLKEAKEELRLLKSQNNAIRRENEDLKGQLLSLQRRNGELDSVNKSLHQNIATMKESGDGQRREEEIRRLKEQIQDLEERAELNDELQVDAANEEHQRQLQEQQMQHEKQRKKQQRLIDKLEERLEDNKAEIEELNRQKHGQITALQHENESLNEELTQCQQRMDSLQRELKKEKLRAAEWHEKYLQKVAEEEEDREYREKMEAAVVEEQMLQNESESVDHLIAIPRPTLQPRSSAELHVAERVEKLKERLHNVREQKDAKIVELSNRLEETEEDLEDHRNFVAQLKKRNEHLSTKNEQLMMEVAELKEETEAMETLKEDIVALEGEKKELMAKQEEMTKHLNEVKEQNQQRLQQIYDGDGQSATYSDDHEYVDVAPDVGDDEENNMNLDNVQSEKYNMYPGGS